MRLALTLLLIAGLAACSTKYDLAGNDWKKPGAVSNAITQDEMECVRGAREAGNTLYVGGGLSDAVRIAIEESQRKRAYERCMTDKGYQPSS